MARQYVTGGFPFGGVVAETGTRQYVGGSGTVVDETVAAAGGVTVAPSTGSVTIAGNAPTIATSNNQNVTPSTGAVIVTGQQPTVSIPASISPFVGSVTIAGQQPTVLANVSADPGTGSVVITGQQPTVLTSIVVNPTTGAVTIAGQAPTVAVTGNALVAPSTGALTITGQQPTIEGAVADNLDTHDGGPATEEQARYWKRLKDREDEKRRKREKAAAEAKAPKPVQEIPAALKGRVTPASKAPVPAPPKPSNDHLERAKARVEELERLVNVSRAQIQAERVDADRQSAEDDDDDVLTLLMLV